MDSTAPLRPQKLVQNLERARGLRLLKAKILVELSRSTSGEMNVNDLGDLWIELDTELIPEEDRELAISALMEEGLVVPPVTETEGHGRLTDYYALTNSGLAEVQASTRNKSSAIFKYRTLGEHWLRQELEDVYGTLMDSPLSALPGAPSQIIDLSSHSELQNQVLEKLDQLVTAINANNAFRQGDPANQIAISESLKRLGSELKKGKTAVGKIEAAGFGALSFIAMKFADTVVGTMATDLWSAITHLVHLLL